MARNMTVKPDSTFVLLSGRNLFLLRLISGILDALPFLIDLDCRVRQHAQTSNPRSSQEQRNWPCLGNMRWLT
jgi:hypothetical protein